MGQPGRDTAGAGVAFGLILVLLVLCGGGYAAAYVGSTDRLPRDTTVSGVDVGGLSPAAAEVALRRGLAGRSDSAVAVVVDGRTVSVTPSAAGLGVDYAASVHQAASGRSWRPQRLWRYYTGGDRLAPVTTFDQQAFDEWLTATDSRVGRPPREGAVSFDGTRIVTTQPVGGRTLEPEGARRLLRSVYAAALAGRADSPVELPTVPRSPAIDDHDVHRAVRAFANPAMSGPVTLVLDRARLRFSPEQYADALSLVPRDGRLRPEVDREDVDRLVRQAIRGTDAPVPATVALVHGVPTVIPERPGAGFHARDVAAAFEEVVARPEGRRTIRVRVHAVHSDFRTRDARALGITQKVSTSTTPLPAGDPHGKDVGRAVGLVDGTVLQPGQTFTLGEAVPAGETDAAAPQLATSIFDAMLHAGLQDLESAPHTFSPDPRSAGRHAAPSWGSLDVRFRNDTHHGVLISAEVTTGTRSHPGQVKVSMWSTRTWDVSTTTGDRYNRTSPTRRVLRTSDCRPDDGRDGFDVDLTRTFRRHGETAVDHTETLATHYLPVDAVVCKPPRH